MKYLYWLHFVSFTEMSHFSFDFIRLRLAIFQLNLMIYWVRCLFQPISWLNLFDSVHSIHLTDCIICFYFEFGSFLIQIKFDSVSFNFDGLFTIILMVALSQSCSLSLPKNIIFDAKTYFVEKNFWWNCQWQSQASFGHICSRNYYPCQSTWFDEL